MFRLAYCDKIADTIKKALVREIDAPARVNDNIIKESGPIKSDLDPEGGWFVSPKKMIQVWDKGGKAYIITVEETPMLDKETF
jgi:hypothetical protein